MAIPSSAPGSASDTDDPTIVAMRSPLLLVSSSLIEARVGELGVRAGALFWGTTVTATVAALETAPELSRIV